MDDLSLKNDFISTKSASEISGYNADYLSRLAREKKIHAIQVGRAWLVDRASLAAFIAGQADRNKVLAKELSRARELEYRARLSSNKKRPVQPIVPSIEAFTTADVTRTNAQSTIARAFAEALRTVEITTLRGPVPAIAVAVLTLGFGAFAAQAATSNDLLAKTQEVITQASLGAHEIALDRVNDIAAAIGSAHDEASLAFARIQDAASSTSNGYAIASPTVAPLDAHLAYAAPAEIPSTDANVPSNPRASQEVAAGTSAISGIIATIAHDPIGTVLSIPHGIAVAYAGIGNGMIALSNESFAAYARAIDGAGALAYEGKSAGDEKFRAAPRAFVAADIAFGNALIGGSQALLDSYDKVVYGYVQAAPTVPPRIALGVLNVGLEAQNLALSAVNAWPRAFVGTAYAIAGGTESATHGVIALGEGVSNALGSAIALVPSAKENVTLSSLALAGQAAVATEAAASSTIVSANALGTFAAAPIQNSGFSMVSAAVALSKSPVLSTGQQFAVATYAFFHRVASGTQLALSNGVHALFVYGGYLRNPFSAHSAVAPSAPIKQRAPAVAVATTTATVVAIASPIANAPAPVSAPSTNANAGNRYITNNYYSTQQLSIAPGTSYYTMLVNDIVDRAVTVINRGGGRSSGGGGTTIIQNTGTTTGGAVDSVFGRAGTVVAQAGDYTTDLVTEGANLYFTAGRATSNFITNLAATSSVASITTLPNLSLPLSQTTGSLAINRGGTGTTTAPSFGQLLVGNGSGGYSLVATSSLGITGGGGGAVDTVFGRAGTVVAQAGDYTTDQVTEGANLYFTNARARSALSATGTGLSYSSATGIFALSTSSFSGSGSNLNADLLDGLDSTYFLANSFATTSANYFLSTKSTTDLAEGANLYFTPARATANFISNLAATTSVASITTLPSLSLPTSQLTGMLGIANGGTGTSTGGVTNGVEYYDGTKLTNSSGFVYTGTNLGIGTTSPFAALAVAGSGFFNGNLTAANITATGTLTAYGGQFNTLALANTDGHNNGDEGLTLQTGNGDGAWYIFTNQHTSSPTNPGALQIYDINNNKTPVTIDANTPDGLLWLRSSGNIGIGTSSPFATLSVAGSGYFNGTLGVSGTTTLATTLNGVLKAVSGVVSNAVDGTDFISPSTFASFFTTNLAATTSVASITTLPNLSLPLTQTTGTLGVARGGTGQNSFTSGSLIYGAGAGALQSVATTSATLGLGLSYSGTLGTLVGGTSGSLTIATSSLYSGSTGQVSYFSGTNALTATSSLFIASSGNVGIGTTSPFAALAVAGNGYFNGNVTASNITATGTLNVSGNTTLASATSTNFAITNLAPSLLKVNGSGSVIAAVAGTDYLTSASGVTSVRQLGGGSTQSGAITLATTSATSNGLTVGINVTNSGGAFTFAPTLSGTLTVAGGGTGSTTLSGILVGSTTNAVSSLKLPSFLSLSGSTLSLGTLGEANGGTGITSYNPGDVLYADNTGTLVALPRGSDGQVLKLQSGFPAWGLDATSGGGGGNDGIFATSTGVIYPLDTSQILLVGSNATSSNSSIFEVHGQSYYSSKVGIGTTSPAQMLSVGGNAYVTGGLGVGVANTAAGTLVVSGQTTLATSLSGVLKAVSGVVSNAVDGTDFISPSTFASFFTSNLAATSSVASITTLPNLSLPLSQTTGTLGVARGGTGQTSFTSSSLLYGAGSGALQSVATTSQTLGLGLSFSGTLGALVGGTSGSLTIATSSLYSGTTGQIPYFSGTNTLSATSSIFVAANGNIGIGTTSPFAALSVAGNGFFNGNITASNLAATGTLSVSGNTALANATSTNFAITGLASTLLKVNASGSVIAAIPGTDYLTSSTGVTSIQQLGGGSAQAGAITFATSSATSNGLTVGLNITNSSGAFTFAPTLSGTLTVAGGGTGQTSFTSSSLLYGAGSGALQSVATSSFATSAEFSYSGTLGALVGGANGSLSLAANGVGLTKIAQIGANTLLGNATGATGNVTAISTSTLNIGGTAGNVTGTVAVGNGGTGSTTLSGILVGNGASAINTLTLPSLLSLSGSTLSLNGALGIANGGTGTTTGGVTNGVEYYDGTKLTNGGGFIYNGSQVAIGTTTPWTSSPFTVAYTGGDFTSSAVAYIDASQSSITNAAGLFIRLPSTGNRKGFQIANGSDTTAWASFEFNVGGSSKPGFSFGPGGSTARDTTLYRDSASVLRTGSTFIADGSLGIGTTSPFATLSVAGNGFFNGNLTASNITATGTLAVSGNTTLANATSTTLGITGITSSLLKTNGSGSVIAAVAGTDYLTPTTGVTSIQQTGGGTAQKGAITFATSSQTTNGLTIAENITNSGAAFTFAPTLSGTLTVGGGGTGQTSFTSGSLVYGAGSGALQNVATTSATLGLGLSYSGTLGALVGGTSGTLTIATSSLFTGTTGQIPYFSATNTLTATSSLSLGANGNVGIGTTSPGATLAVNGSILVNGINSTVNGLGIWNIDNHNSGNADFTLRTFSGSGYWDIVAGTAGAFGLYDAINNKTPFAIDVNSPDNTLMLRSSGNVGIGTSTPGSLLSIGNTNGINFSTGTSTFSSTGGINLASGCFAVNGTCITNGVSSIQQTGGGTAQAGAITFATSSASNNGLALGLNITNSSGAFTFAPTLSGTLTVAGGGTGQGSFTSGNLIYGAGSGALQSVATSSLAVGGEFTYSGTLGALVGGTGGSLSLATNGVGLTKIAQIGANSLLGNATGATGNVTAISTSTLNIGGTASNVTGTVAVANGGTGSTTLSGILAGNGTSAVKSLVVGTGLTFDGTTLAASGVAGVTSLQQLGGGSAQTGAITFATSSSATTGLTIAENITNSGAAFTFAPTLSGTLNVANGGTGQGSFTSGSLVYGAGSGALQSVATTSATLGLGLSYSGTLGALVGGTSGSLTVATSSLFTGTAGQIPYFTGTNTLGATSTISIFVPSSNVGIGTSGVGVRLSVAGHGTGTGLTFQTVDGSFNPTFTILDNGKVGIGTTSPFAALAVAGNGYFGGNLTATGTLAVSGNTTLANATSTGFAITSLASSLLKVDGSGNVIAATAGTDFEDPLTFSTGLHRIGDTITNTGVTSVSAGSGIGLSASSGAVTISNSGLLSLQQLGGGTAQTGAITFATSSATSNGLTVGLNITNSSGAFTFTPALTGTLTVAGGGTGQTSFTSGNLVYGAGSGALQNVATTSATLGLGLSYSGTLGALVGGTGGSLSIATSSLYAGTAGQLPYFSGTNALTATSSIFLATSGNFGIGTTSPFATLSVAGSGFFNGNLTASNITATGTLGVSGNTTLANATSTGFAITSLASTLLKTNASGSVIAATAGTDYLTSTTGVVSIQQTGGGTAQKGALTLATSSATSNGLTVGLNITNSSGAFTFAPALSGTLTVAGGGTGQGSFTAGNLIYGAGAGALQNVATTSATLGLGLSYSGTLGTLVGGASGSLTIATSSLYTGTAGQFPYFSGTNALTATSSLFIATSGNIGVGTTSPFAKLAVFGGGDYASHAASTLFAIGSSTAGRATSTLLTFLSGGNLGIGTTSPYAQLSIGGGNLVLGAATAGGTPGDLFLPKLGIAAGSFLAVDATGKVIATTTPSGSGSGTVGSGTTGQFPYYAGSGTALTATSSLFLASSGFVGVGTTTPIGRLDVSTGVAGADVLISQDSGTNILSLNGKTAFNAGNVGFEGGGTNGSELWINAPSGISYFSGSSIPFVMDSGGNVVIGSDDTWSTGAAGGNSLVVENLIGIGTTTPGTIFSVQGVTNFTTSTSTFEGTGGINLTAGCFAINGTCVGAGSGSGTVGSGTTGQFPYYAGSGTTLTATSSFFLAASSKIGVGSTTPFARFAVTGLGTGTGLTFQTTNSSFSPTFTILDNGNVGIGTTSPKGLVGIQTATNQANAFTVSNSIGSSTLEVDTLDSANNIFEVATSSGSAYFDITSGGNVGLGSTSPWRTLSVAGSASFTNLTSAGTGDFVCLNTTTKELTMSTTCSLSTQKVKNNIVPISSTAGLGQITQLQPVTFLYDNGFGDDGSTTQAGFIAEQAAAVNPLFAEYATSPFNTPNGMVNAGDPDGINWNAIAAASVIAIQQLDARTSFITNSAASSTQALSVSSNGSIGVGTTTAGKALSVNGDTLVTGNLTAGSFTTTGALNAGSFSIAGSVSASSFQVPRAAFTGALTAAGFASTTIPSSALTTGNVDALALAAYNLGSLSALASRVSSIDERLDSMQSQLDALAAGQASSTPSGGPIAIASSTIINALHDFGVFIMDGIAQFKSIAADRFIAATDSAGNSSAGQGTVLAGNTTVVINNNYVTPTSKIFVSFTATTTSAWYITDKQQGSFRLVLAQPQQQDATFDYFIVETDGQIATSTSGFSQGVDTSNGTDTNSGSTVPGSQSVVDGGPRVTLIGSAAMSIFESGAWDDPGATAADAAGVDISGSIEVSGTVDTNTPGIYTVTYIATDSNGLVGKVSRVVTVVGAGSVSDSLGSGDTGTSTGSTTPQSPPDSGAGSGPATSTPSSGDTGTSTPATP